MATPGKPIDEMTRKRIVRLAESKVPTKRIARIVEVCPETARKYVRRLRELVAKLPKLPPSGQ